MTPEPSSTSAADAATVRSTDAGEPGALSDSSKGNDCYSAGERGWMEYGQRLRAVWLQPALAGLTHLRITPDLITLLSGLAGVAFAPFWLSQWEGLALGCLVAHVALDGLDGPLARYQQRASPRGSFTDTFTDQIVVTIVAVAWMIKQANAWAIGLGGSYIFLYTLVVAMAMVRNALAVPYSWLVRPRFFMFTALAFEWVGWPWVSYATIAICCILLIAKTVSGFLKLREQL